MNDEYELTDAGRNEYAALVRDAKRYRWLRPRAYKSYGDICFDVPNGYDDHGLDADAAIDAVMEAK